MSRSKGKRGEREIVNLLPGAARLSADYQPGPDVLWQGLVWEVKRRNTNRGFSLPDQLLDDGTNDVVALRADRGDWVISMRISTLLRLVGEDDV